MLSSSVRARDVRVALLAAVLAASAVLLVLLLPEPREEAGLPWWALAAGFAVAELVVVHVQVRRDSVSVSFGEIPIVLGLTFATPTSYVLANLAGSALVLLLSRRQRGLKLAFNLGLFAFEASLASTVYLLLAGPAEASTVRAALAALVAVVGTNLASSLAITAVITVSTGRLDRGPLMEAATTGLVGSVANASFALLTVVLLVREPAALALLLVVFATLVVVYRAYAKLGRGHARLTLLYQFTRGVAGQVAGDLVADRVLSEARDVLQSGVAELVLLPGPDRPGRRLRLGGGDRAVVEVPGGPRWWAGAAEGRPVLCPRGSTAAAALLSGVDADDAMAAPLQAAGEVIGVLAVAGRPPFLPTYGDDDLRLFQTLADHAAVAVRNVGLVDQLRTEVAEREHQALHDALTGLPNRRQFAERLGETLAGGAPLAVVLLDLVDFSSINDALGYEIGDRLLVEVGSRLHDRVGPGRVARLGNDEFAVLLAGVDDVEAARARTSQLLRALEAPFPVEGFALEVRAVAGIALAPEHGRAAELLLRRADAALSGSKQHGTEVSFYNLWSDQNSARRLQLVADLRLALAGGEVAVHYQPKSDPRTGATVGAEALARWTHPQLGPVSPDEFIPLAEHSGLIAPLTTLVLRAALTECAAWRAGGSVIGVAVNLSARGLTDPDLPRHVVAELHRAGVPPQALTLEITESAVMSDLQGSLDVLEALRATGVRLSVDDFGTGHSALAYLKHLPVHEMKIDKSFVQGLCTDRSDVAIVRAAVDLGHALGLSVVAEGVEDEPTRAQLRDLGCDVLQGYLFSRPLPADRFRAWLAVSPRTLVALRRV